MTNEQDEQLDRILEEFAKWTIQNVEHGIYIPLPSPETKAALRAYVAKEMAKLTEAKDNAYWERDQLVAVLSKIYPSHLAVHPDTDKDWEDDWRIIVCIHTPVGQASWHIHNTEAKNFRHLKQEPSDWDGHTTEEKYKRLTALAANASAEGE